MWVCDLAAGESGQWIWGKPQCRISPSHCASGSLQATDLNINSLEANAWETSCLFNHRLNKVMEGDVHISSLSWVTANNCRCNQRGNCTS